MTSDEAELCGPTTTPPSIATWFDVGRCPACGFAFEEHDADPIGAGLTQYTCPEDDWVNPTTGHSGDCGCPACHMTQTL